MQPYTLCTGNMLMEEHQVLQDVTGEYKTELSVKFGDVVMVLAKDLSGEDVHDGKESSTEMRGVSGEGM